MADQIFPLSPIAARAALPSDEDYDAIRDAFMETARGRWFLNEYTKRNRNADTTLVLEAVARLESSMTAQKQELPPDQDRSAQVIAAILEQIAEHRAQADAVLPAREAPTDDSPALKGVRVLREMAWALRESGSDGRIPDLLQKQATAIEDGLNAKADRDIRGKLLAIFDSLAQAIATAPGQAEAAAAVPHVGTHADMQPTAPREDQQPASEPETIANAEAVALPDTLSELDSTLAVLSGEFGREQPDEPEWPAQDRISHDAPISAPGIGSTVDAPALETQPSSPPASAAVMSLGAALLENGVIARPDTVRGDPLAAFKRMTQAERIAFFS